MFHRSVAVVRHLLPSAVIAVALFGPVAGPLASSQVAAGEPALPTLEDLLPRVQKTLAANPELFDGYRFRQRITSRDRDDDGALKKTTVREYDVRPNAWGAPAEWVLIREDGKPVPKERIDKRREELRRRSDVSPATRARLRREAAEEQRETEEAIDEVFRNLDARIMGRVQLAGHSTLEIAFEPRPEAHARTRIGKIFRQIAGRVWIAEQDYQLVRFECEVVNTIQYGWGVIARIHRGSRLEFERRLVDDVAWLPASYHMQGSVRTLLFKLNRFDRQSEFFGHQRIDASDASASAAAAR